MDKRLFHLAARLERIRLDRLNRPEPDALSRSLEALFRECTEQDLKALAAELESDEV